MIADFLLGIGAIAAAGYCAVLSRRLQRLTHLESGMGAAIAVLSAQVDDMTRTLGQAQQAAHASASGLVTQTERAEEAVRRIEVLLASLHDLPEAEAGSTATRRTATRSTATRRTVRRRTRQPEAPETLQ